MRRTCVRARTAHKYLTFSSQASKYFTKFSWSPIRLATYLDAVVCVITLRCVSEVQYETYMMVPSTSMLEVRT